MEKQEWNPGRLLQLSGQYWVRVRGCPLDYWLFSQTNGRPLLLQFKDLCTAFQFCKITSICKSVTHQGSGYIFSLAIFSNLTYHTIKIIMPVIRFKSKYLNGRQ